MAKKTENTSRMTRCCLREHKTQVFPNEYKRKTMSAVSQGNNAPDAIKNTSNDTFVTKHAVW